MINRKIILESLLQNMHAIRHKLMAEYTGRKDLAMNPSQGFVLRFVAKNSNTSIKAIAEALQITSSAATQLVDGLVEKGYLVRKEDPDDRRVTTLSLPESAKKIFKEFREQGLRKMMVLFDALTDEELVQYAALHKKIADTLEKKG